MHILFFTHYFPPEVNAPASRTHEHAKYWVKAGHKVTVITNHPNHPHGNLFKGYKNRLFSKEIIDGIRVIRVWTYLVPNSGVFKRTLNFLIYSLLAFIQGLFVKGEDVIVGTTPQFFCGFSGLLVSKMKGKPFIGEIRDLWPDSIAAVGAIDDSKFLKIFYWLEKYFYNKADHLVVLTRSFAKHVKELSRTRTSFIPNGVDHELWLNLDRSNNGHILLQKGDLKVGYIGTFGMAHGLDLVLDVAKETQGANKVQYYLIGDGSEKKHLESRIEEENINNVSLYGLQPKSSIPFIIDQLDVMLVLLKRDPVFKTVIPSKLFEGMVMKKPLVVGVEGETKQIVENAGAGLTIVPESRSEFKEAILKLRDQQDLRNQLANDGYQHVTKFFIRKKLAGQYINIFKALTAQ
ncbi:MAG: glycosyltransferase [Candidatus Marinimicrobia bacterium]|nr:glycosyltransferase [Candidatus Neomarinimicrobiota bacterium]